MTPRIPLAHRLRHLASFLLLILPYAIVASAIGAAALTAIGSAGALGDPAARVGEAGTGEAPSNEERHSAGAPDAARGARGVPAPVQRFLVSFAATLATLGHWAAVLVVGLTHRGDYELHRFGGWSRIHLWLLSWLASAMLGGALLAVAL